ncbi:MAG: hypothetical protein Q4G11_05530 [Gallicola sp.]|nr:hypothetical protein [Gallicola sp.]
MKAPKFPSYKEVVEKKKPQAERLTKSEWKALVENKIEIRKEQHKESDKNRLRPITIAFRASKEDREKIFAKIALSGLSRQEYMTKAILETPIEVVATQNIIDQCRDGMHSIYQELSRLNSFSDLSEVKQTELETILEIIKAAIKKAPST